MEQKQCDLETKYQKLATEYSKVRSQATVLKKAVLDEQGKNAELKELIKRHEQTIRKHDQEMESLTFRNEQLTKRITVLQQELQINSGGKKNKNKNLDIVVHSDMSVLDEELQKKIMENAQLYSSMADKEFELSDYKEKNNWLENKVRNLEKQLTDAETSCSEEIAKLKTKQCLAVQKNDQTKLIKHHQLNEEDSHWKENAERWKLECEMLRQKPESNEQLTEYYESQLREIFESRQLCQSETKALWGENLALNSRLENFIVQIKELQERLDESTEELTTTTENYKSQLDAMTEHLAAQNDKITKQCDQIQDLKMKLLMKK